MANTKQVKAANVLNNAQVTTVTGGDGESLIGNAHPLATGGTFSNVLQLLQTLTKLHLSSH